ncbi:BEN domain-containing protein 5 [Frankliniella fusca]|uniref:BEN domain-containing protein 5 n=1 Tax=Frankliniella fusca TaxID=407009 RepID=A0AAE1GWY8_9NEOP|nr:BEN domain-containing protein 5 [Frankliniella fusca]
MGYFAVIFLGLNDGDEKTRPINTVPSPFRSPARQSLISKNLPKNSPLKKRKSPLKTGARKKSLFKFQEQKSSVSPHFSPEKVEEASSSSSINTGDNIKKKSKSSSGSEPSGFKKSAFKKIKPKEESMGSYKDHRTLGKMIHSALIGDEPLQSDGSGKVHLGNNIWIKESAWLKFSTSSKSLSQTVQNLTECIWGWQKCATLSLKGGVSPKTPDAAPKDSAPIGGVQAILGFYRAKLMQQGLKISEVLDSNVEKLGKAYITSKFHNAHKKYQRELEKANDFADRTLAAKDGDEQNSD